jgi:hypothetical protein
MRILRVRSRESAFFSQGSLWRRWENLARAWEPDAGIASRSRTGGVQPCTGDKIMDAQVPGSILKQLVNHDRRTAMMEAELPGSENLAACMSGGQCGDVLRPAVSDQGRLVLVHMIM